MNNIDGRCTVELDDLRVLFHNNLWFYDILKVINSIRVGIKTHVLINKMKYKAYVKIMPDIYCAVILYINLHILIPKYCLIIDKYEAF